LLQLDGTEASLRPRHRIVIISVFLFRTHAVFMLVNCYLLNTTGRA